MQFGLKFFPCISPERQPAETISGTVNLGGCHGHEQDRSATASKNTGHSKPY